MDFASIQPILIKHYLDDTESCENIVAEMFMLLIEYAQDLKLKGNSLFKLGKYEDATSFYKKAVISICFAISTGREDEVVLRELATSLNLNLAFCALKIGNFEETMSLCTLILYFDTRNIKALFRRAFAFLKLGKLEDSYNDLQNAKSLEPNNKDVVKELAFVEGLLRSGSDRFSEVEEVLVNDSCKRKAKTVADCFEEVGSSGIKSSDTTSSECLKLVAGDVGIKTDSAPSKAANKRPRLLPHMNFQQPLHNVSTDENTSRPCEVENRAKFAFVNKRKPSTCLRVSASDMGKLA